MSAASLTRRKSAGRPSAPETPHQVIEGEAYEAGAELVYYRDLDCPERLHGDAGCDDAVRRMERAFKAGDAAAFWSAVDDYWTHDSDEDEAALRGDQRVAVAHMHVKRIPAQIVEIEMGACPLTGRAIKARRSAGSGRP